MIALNSKVSHNVVPKKAWLLLLAISGAAAFFFWKAPAVMFSWEVVTVIIALAGILGLLWVTISFPGPREAWPQKVFLLMWWVMLVSEEIFDPFVLPKFGVEAAENAMVGHFSLTAYGEAAVWILAAVVSLFCLKRKPEFLRGLLSKPYRWLVLFGLLCVVTTYYTPQRLFALAWAFKLAVVILIVKACASFLNDADEMGAFFQVTLIGFFFLSVVPLVVALINPMYGDDGRLANIAPDGLSAMGGTLLLVALTVSSTKRKLWPIPVALIGLAVMIFAGGKTAIAAGLLCGLLLLVMQGQVLAALGLSAAAAMSGALLFAFTRLGEHYKWYLSSGQLNSLSGRAELWETVLPEIWQRPVAGHGYLASRFMALQIENVPFGAPHLHNGFLEVMYNQGVIGLLVMVMIHLVIVVNLAKAFWRSSSGQPVRLFAVGSIAIYLNLLINGMANASFGGRAEAPFMLLLALVAISTNLVTMTEEQREQLPQPAK